MPLGRLLTNGVNENVVFDGSGAEWDTGFYTVMAWVQRNDAFVGNSYIFARDSNFSVSLSGSGRFQHSIRDAGSPFTVQSPATHVNGRLYHVAASYDGTTIKVRVYDSTTGVATSYTTTHAGISAANTNFIIGGETAAQDTWGGFVAALKHWQHTAAGDVLTDAQIDVERWSLLPIHSAPDCLIAAPLGWHTTEPNLVSQTLTGSLTGSPAALTATLVPVSMTPRRRVWPAPPLVTGPKYAYSAFPLGVSFYAPGSKNVLKNPSVIAAIGAYGTNDSYQVNGVLSPSSASATPRDGGDLGVTAPPGTESVTVPIIVNDFNGPGTGDHSYNVVFDGPAIGDLESPEITSGPDHTVTQSTITVNLTATDSTTWRMCLVALPPDSTIPTSQQVSEGKDASGTVVAVAKRHQTAFNVSGTNVFGTVGGYVPAEAARICGIVEDVLNNRSGVFVIDTATNESSIGGRPFGAELVEQFDSQVAKYAVFVELMFDGDPFRAHNAVGIISATEPGGTARDWYGIGDLGQVELIRETRELEAHQIDLILSGLDTELLNKTQNTNPSGRVAKIYLGAFNDNEVFVGNLSVFWRGTMDKMGAHFGVDNNIIRVRCEGRAASLLRSRSGLMTDTMQQQRYPGDKFLQYAAKMQNTQIIWAGRSVQRSQAAPTRNNPTGGGKFK